MGIEDQTAIIANAARLLKDAKLLVKDKRHASAFALSVLALEEIGKVVLGLWGKPEALPKLSNKRPSAHVRKQAAVSSLLLGKSLEKEWGDVIRKEQETEGLVELIARFIFDGEAGRFHRKVAIGAVDKTKQIALYFDDWREAMGVTADQFDSADVEPMLEKCSAVIAALGDPRAMRTGKAIYEAGIRKAPMVGSATITPPSMLP